MSVLKEMMKNCKNCKGDRIDFLAISPKLFELQRPTTLKNIQNGQKMAQKTNFLTMPKYQKCLKMNQKCPFFN